MAMRANSILTPRNGSDGADDDAIAGNADGAIRLCLITAGIDQREGVLSILSVRNHIDLLDVVGHR